MHLVLEYIVKIDIAHIRRQIHQAEVTERTSSCYRRQTDFDNLFNANQDNLPYTIRGLELLEEAWTAQDQAKTLI